MPKQYVSIGSTIQQNAPDSFGVFCRSLFGVCYTLDGCAQTFAFDYIIMQSENMFCYSFIGNSFSRGLRIAV